MESEDGIRGLVNSWESGVDRGMLCCEGVTTGSLPLGRWAAGRLGRWAAGPLFQGCEPLPPSYNKLDRIIAGSGRVSR
jgi:hypothetical protein